MTDDVRIPTGDRPADLSLYTEQTLAAMESLGERWSYQHFGRYHLSPFSWFKTGLITEKQFWETVIPQNDQFTPPF